MLQTGAKKLTAEVYLRRYARGASSSLPTPQRTAACSQLPPKKFDAKRLTVYVVFFVTSCGRCTRRLQLLPCRSMMKSVDPPASLLLSRTTCGLNVAFEAGCCHINELGTPLAVYSSALLGVAGRSVFYLSHTSRQMCKFFHGDVPSRLA